jgi:hypothetical protein
MQPFQWQLGIWWVLSTVYWVPIHRARISVPQQWTTESYIPELAMAALWLQYSKVSFSSLLHSHTHSVSVSVSMSVCLFSVHACVYHVYFFCHNIEHGFTCCLLIHTFRFDAMSMLLRLRDQRVAFVGDSMGRTQWESLVCLLMNGVHDKWSVKEIHGKTITKTTPHLAVLFPGFNVTIEYYRSRWLVHIGQPPKHAPKRVKATLKLDTLESASSQWQTANVLVFNSGHWWTAAKTYRLCVSHFTLCISHLNLVSTFGLRRKRFWGCFALTNFR